MKRLWQLVGTILLLSFFACNTTHTKDQEATENQTNSPQISKASEEGRMTETNIGFSNCFLKTLENEPIVIDGIIAQRMIDSAKLTFTITGNDVEGEFNYLPAEQDATLGRFNGTIDSNKLIKAIYVFSSEGESYKEGLIIKIKENSAQIKLVSLNLNPVSKELEIIDNDADFDQLPRIQCK